MEGFTRSHASSCHTKRPGEVASWQVRPPAYHGRMKPCPGARTLLLPLLGVVLASLVASCVRDARAPAEPVRVILDFLPNAVHVGLYRAQAAGYYRDAGLAVALEPPTTTSDTLRLMAAGQADLGIVSLMDFLNARCRGERIRIVMALEQRPLGSLFCLASSGITRPRDLKGRLVSITGVLSDEAGVRWMVLHDGGDPSRVRLITLGFNTAQQVAARNVDAAFGFWNQDAVQVARSQPTTVLRLDAHGVPPYPELVVFAREETLEKRPAVVRAFLAATRRGYDDALANPPAALASMASLVQGDSEAELRPYFDAVAPVLRADAPAYGHVDLAVLGAYCAWLHEAGVLEVREAPAAFATNAYLPGGKDAP